MIDALAHQQIEAAVAAPSGRAADTAFGGHEKSLRQTLMAFRARTQLSEHQNRRSYHLCTEGKRLAEGGRELVAGEGRGPPDPAEQPPQPRSEEDSAVLFTVVKTDRVVQLTGREYDVGAWLWVRRVASGV